MTGGFGGESCHMCHADNPLNAPGGSLRLSGLPVAYELGRTYGLTITLSREALRIGGFQLAARGADGGPAGSWHARDDRARVAGESIQHTKRGTEAPVEGTASWEFEWTAPATPAGPVLFAAAGNASNDDASALGDFIYTTLVTVSPAPAK
jgi:hypothetical protein